MASSRLPSWIRTTDSFDQDSGPLRLIAYGPPQLDTWHYSLHLFLLSSPGSMQEFRRHETTPPFLEVFGTTGFWLRSNAVIPQTQWFLCCHRLLRPALLLSFQVWVKVLGWSILSIFHWTWREVGWPTFPPKGDSLQRNSNVWLFHLQFPNTHFCCFFFVVQLFFFSLKYITYRATFTYFSVKFYEFDKCTQSYNHYYHQGIGQFHDTPNSLPCLYNQLLSSALAPGNYWSVISLQM